MCFLTETLGAGKNDFWVGSLGQSTGQLMGFDRHTIRRWLTFCGFPHFDALEHIWEHSDSFIGSTVIEILFSYVSHILPHLCILWQSRFHANDQRRLTLSLPISTYCFPKIQPGTFCNQKDIHPFPIFTCVLSLFTLFCSCISWLSCCWDETSVKISLKKEEFILAYSLTVHIPLWLESPGAWGSAHSQERVWEVLVGLCEQLG